MLHQRAASALKLDGLAAARAFFEGCMADSDPRRESLWVAHVDDRSRCLHLSRHDGDETSTDFPIVTIIADAAAHRSAGIVLAHNHPSGDARPAKATAGPRAAWPRRPRLWIAQSWTISSSPAINAPASGGWVICSARRA